MNVAGNLSVKAQKLLYCLLLGSAAAARAQGGCPEGSYYYAADPSLPGHCIAMSGQAQRPPPGPRWALTWGAIAVDRGNGQTGVVVGKDSKSAAKKEAMRRCAKNGADRCKIVLVYQHQCAAIGDVAGAADDQRFVAMYSRGPTLDVVSAEAIKGCEASNPGRECKVSYAECTEPVLVK